MQVFINQIFIKIVQAHIRTYVIPILQLLSNKPCMYVCSLIVCLVIVMILDLSCRDER